MGYQLYSSEKDGFQIRSEHDVLERTYFAWYRFADMDVLRLRTEAEGVEGSLFSWMSPDVFMADGKKLHKKPRFFKTLVEAEEWIEDNQLVNPEMGIILYKRDDQEVGG